ncbi:hypothetical protein [Acidipila sp. EB88]|uniref:hypothetical protein n=1 Tax=Acidipila sp. EB88 TaxID=2305226 RepID=UPI0013154021|nr:hypothetical protein [Acidipila sp. EB88]
MATGATARVVNTWAHPGCTGIEYQGETSPPQPAAAPGSGPCAVVACAAQGVYHFNGQWACSVDCLEQLLRAVVIAEQALAAAAALHAAPRVKLGRILIEQGIINEAQLEQALRSQRSVGAGKLGCWLKQQVELPEADFTAALSIQWQRPVFRMGAFQAARMVSYLPAALMEKHGALPLRITGAPERLSICFEDHIDLELLSAAERMHGLSVDAGLLTATEFWQVTRELLGQRPPACVSVEAASVPGMTAAMSQLLCDPAVITSRLVAVHGCYWLRVWKQGSTAHQTFGGSLEHDSMRHHGMHEGVLVPCDFLCNPQ